MARYTGMFRLYPIYGKSTDGFIDHDKALIKQSILTLLNTHKGSRVYDPDFGTTLYRLIHEPNIQRTRNVAKTEIEHVITKYEPRAELLDVSVYAGNNEHSSQVVIVVSIKYVEFDEVEDIEIRLAAEEQWINEEGTDIDPVEDWMRADIELRDQDY